MERFVALKEVLRLTSLSRSQIYRLIEAKKFPSAVPLGPHRKAFLERELREWMDARIAERAAA